MPAPRRYSPFQRRQRTAARAALYGSLAIVAVAAYLGARYLDRPVPQSAGHNSLLVDYESLPEVRLLQRYIQVDTTGDKGDEVAGARFLAAELAKSGIRATVEVLGPRHANLWAVLEGQERQAVVLHSHIDTDPVPDPSVWMAPPFAGRIVRPYIVGRGAFDMKSIAAAQLVALADLRRSGARPRRSVIFLATGGEESAGSELGARWVLRHHPELAERFGTVLTEGGGIEEREFGEVKYWGIECVQRRLVAVAACGPSRQRLEELREEVRAASEENDDVQLTPELQSFLKAYAPTRDNLEWRLLLERPEQLIADRAAFSGLPRYIRAMFRDEILATRIEEVPGGYELPLKFLLRPHSDFAAARAHLLPPRMTLGLQVAVDDPQSADHGSPPDHPDFRAMAEIVHERYPGATVGPYFLTYQITDSRFFRAAGIPSYGFSPFPVFSTDTAFIGRVDERIGLPGYVEGVRLYTALLDRLAR